MPGMPGSMSDRKRCHHDFLEAKATGKKPGKRLRNDTNSFFCFLNIHTNTTTPHSKRSGSFLLYLLCHSQKSWEGHFLEILRRHCSGWNGTFKAHYCNCFPLFLVPNHCLPLLQYYHISTKRVQEATEVKRQQTLLIKNVFKSTCHHLWHVIGECMISDIIWCTSMMYDTIYCWKNDRHS